ncbi:MAG: hypothetical protein KJ077_11255 [Anaerolineae bacterium]|nr:hypothetical protein [Anaerolineae bacterium]
MNIYADLPKVLYIEGLDDAGEFGAATCPHCGAQGRYIYWFVCDDGSQRGAMRGCFEHFPKHPFADRYAQILDKEIQNAKRRRPAVQGQGWSLASWDASIKDAIEKYGAGQLSEAAAWEAIREADRAKKQWMKRRGFRR